MCRISLPVMAPAVGWNGNINRGSRPGVSTVAEEDEEGGEESASRGGQV